MENNKLKAINPTEMGNHLKNKIEVYQHEMYEGTLESLEKMVTNLKLKPHQYHFNVLTKDFYNNEIGILMRPGDHYVYRLPQEFQVPIKS